MVMRSNRKSMIANITIQAIIINVFIRIVAMATTNFSLA